MTCRHKDPINNPACSSYQTPEKQLVAMERDRNELMKKFNLSQTPDNSNFEILDTFIWSGTEYPGLVLKVKYESCPNCSYEGTKILVYRNVTLKDVLKWKVIDPHFSDKPPQDYKHAPSPVARFPANEAGWDMAISFVQINNR